MPQGLVGGKQRALHFRRNLSLSWSIRETTGSLAQGNCLCMDMFIQADPDIVVKRALDIHKIYVTSKLSFSRMKVH